MRKRTVACVSALALSSLSVQAADYGRPTTKTFGPYFNWAGFYIGGHAGGAWTDIDWTFFNGAVTESFSQRQSRGVGGGQGGFQFQWDTLVLGLEASYSANFSNSFVTSAALLAASRTRSSRMSDLVMVTPRVGFAWGPMHIYGKGGYASADVEFQAFATNLGVITATSRAREHGWTAGAGFEYAIWQNLVLGIQYDFVTLNVDDRTFEVAAGFAGPNTGTNIDVNRHMVTARLNLLFNPW